MSAKKAINLKIGEIVYLDHSRTVIEVVDEDYLRFTGPYGRSFLITGGDFESIVSAMQSIKDDNHVD